MNNGKICVPVCAETAKEFIEKIKKAEKLADVVELRFDCLKPDELSNATAGIGELDRTRSLATFRPKTQGGHRELSSQERKAFWQSVDGNFWGVDLEGDAAGLARSGSTVIASFHDFSAGPRDVVGDYEKLASLDADIIKIAVQSNDITDAIPVWKLLGRAITDNKRLIPIAMGEAGKWTRILGLAHGAFMTYASLEAGSETAPGQISADDLINIYRIKELDETTDIYGIIGGNTSYSMSPYIHNPAFKAKNVNAVFVPLQVTDLGEFMRRMVMPETREVELNFHGFSVTNPHKQAIMRHLDHIDDAAKEIGAVNTVKIIDGRLHGFNTDAGGFIKPLKKELGDLSDSKAAVIGAGGAARACIYALKKEGAEVTVFARDLIKLKPLVDQFDVIAKQLPTNNNQRSTGYDAFDIIVNATPLGTKGEHQDETVATAEQLEGVKLVYDLIYIPAETRLIREARKAGAKTLGGLEMLVTQGTRQFEIWTGMDAPVDEMAAAAKRRLNS